MEPNKSRSYHLAQDIEQELLLELSNASFTASMRANGFALNTKILKDLLCRSGKKRGYKVLASGCQGADGGEWLYDLVWYIAPEKELMTRQVLVLESEMKPGGSVPNSWEIDGDFQKLVQARADVRVWIGAVPHSPEKQYETCLNYIEMFEFSVLGDVYLFVLFDWTTNSLFTRVFFKG